MVGFQRDDLTVSVFRILKCTNYGFQEVPMTKNNRLRLAAALAASLLAAVFALTPVAAASSARVLKVAFPQVTGFSELSADGTPQGIIVDFLDEIANYTGWKYEYVPVEGDSIVTEYKAGKFDLMGGTYYSERTAEMFAYPDYNTGYSRSMLLARQDDYSLHSYDVKSLNGKTIGVYENAVENIRRLKEFLSFNGLKCTLKYYTYEQISVKGNLYDYLKNGEVDMLLGNSAETGGGFRSVASFDAQPHYIVARPGDQEVIDGLNKALAKIYEANPNFAVERYEAHFAQLKAIDIQLSQEERNFVKQKETVTVAVTRSLHPLLCINEPEDAHDGVLPAILNKISQFSGLTFSLLYADNYADALRMVQDGEADMMGTFVGTREEVADKNLALTEPYTVMNRILVRHKAVSYPADDLTAAVLDGRMLPDEIKAEQIRYYANITEALKAVDRGEADFLCGLSANIEQEIQRNYFSNLVPVTLNDSRNEIRFAVRKPVETELFSLLNKSINSLSSDEVDAIMDENMISIGENRLSLTDFIYAHPVSFVMGTAGVLILAVVIILVLARMHMRAAIMEKEVEKTTAESRAKSDFLSRMSHEIRTPMNAVVGLADLTSMMDDVPPRVQENLSKIRSSSHYLLSLINDILDMSRIDRGMMTIASEPFSLGRMLDDLQSMMTAEADRRSLIFELHKRLAYDGLIGDVVRLRQVLTNLLSNAFKFTPAGGTVRLVVEEIDGNDEGITIEFHVIDTGTGIATEDQRRIFESFEQAGANRYKSQGTGLGLSISRRIVELMGGELSVTSEPGKGSDFYFTITLPQGQPLPEPAPDKRTDMLKGVRFLLAEDNELNAEIAAELLRMQGAAIDRAENGKQAVDMFVSHAPGTYQAILMDIQMPEMDGLEAARAVRAVQRPDAAAIPIIAMTANSFKEDIDAATEAGMNGFIPKPLDTNYLYDVLYRTIKNRSEL